MNGNPHSLMLLIILLIGLAACACHAQAEPALSPDRQRQILRKALNDFDQAVELSRSRPARAQELYRTAAAGFEALIEAGLHNPALEYNLGNARFRLGELGRAILHYRRALWLAPNDRRLLANLGYARRQVKPLIQPTGEDRLVRDILFVHYHTALRDRFWAAVGLSAVGWLLLLLRLWWPKRTLAGFGLAAVVVGLSLSGSVAWQLYDEARRPPAVVVKEDVILRMGRGEGYDPALNEPLGPGVELRILQRRGDWVEVQLANEQRGWLPAEAVQTVHVPG